RTDDVLFRNNATGDTGYFQTIGGHNAGFVEVGPSSTTYSVVGIGDFEGNGTSDILFRNTATGDTGFYDTSSGNAWVDVGPAGGLCRRSSVSTLASNARLNLEKPLIGCSPSVVNPKTALPILGRRSRTALAAGDSGITSSRPVL